MQRAQTAKGGLDMPLPCLCRPFEASCAAQFGISSDALMHEEAFGWTESTETRVLPTL